MVPLEDIVRCYWLLANEPVDTPFTPITNVFDYYSRDLATDSGHNPIIEETGRGLNPEAKSEKRFRVTPREQTLRFRC